MRVAALVRPGCRLHGNIGTAVLRTSTTLRPRPIIRPSSVQSDVQAPPRSRSPVIDFFDDLTRGAVSIDEDDLPQQAATAAATAAAAAGTAAAQHTGAAAAVQRTGASTKPVTRAVAGSFEFEVLAAFAAAVAAVAAYFNNQRLAAAAGSGTPRASESGLAAVDAAGSTASSPLAAVNAAAGSAVNKLLAAVNTAAGGATSKPVAAVGAAADGAASKPAAAVGAAAGSAPSKPLAAVGAAAGSAASKPAAAVIAAAGSAASKLPAAVDAAAGNAPSTPPAAVGAAAGSAASKPAAAVIAAAGSAANKPLAAAGSNDSGRQAVNPPAAAAAGSSDSGRQAVTQEAVQGSAGGLGIQAAALSLTNEGAEVSVGRVAVWLLKCALGLTALQAFKTAVEVGVLQLGAFTAIPPAVVSMLAVPVLLTAVGTKAATHAVSFYDQHLAPWTADLLGLFYVPAVAILPVLVRGMTGTDLAGLVGVTALSTVFTLALTARAAAAWSAPNSTAATATMPPVSGMFRVASGPAAPVVLALSFLAAAGPLALTRFDPVRFGALMALPVGFAWSLLGYIAARVSLQRQQQQQENGGKLGWLSPVLTGAVAANIGVAWHGQTMGLDYLAALSRYYVSGDVLGAGELLCAPLGLALTALGFLVYKHKAAIALHAIAGTAVLSTACSLATSWAAAKLLGVSTDWARALIPRSVTGSTASAFATAIGAPAECAGLVVLLQAAVTLVVGRLVLRLVSGRSPDPAAAGAAVGVTGGAMGVAGVCGGSEVAVANGVLAYALMLVTGGALSCSPQVAAAIGAVVV